jgi:hypothetical protein
LQAFEFFLAHFLFLNLFFLQLNIMRTNWSYVEGISMVKIAILRSEYKKITGKWVPPRYINDKEWIKDKIEANI